MFYNIKILVLIFYCVYYALVNISSVHKHTKNLNDPY